MTNFTIAGPYASSFDLAGTSTTSNSQLSSGLSGISPLDAASVTSIDLVVSNRSPTDTMSLEFVNNAFGMGSADATPVAGPRVQTVTFPVETQPEWSGQIGTISVNFNQADTWGSSNRVRVFEMNAGATTYAASELEAWATTGFQSLGPNPPLLEFHSFGSDPRMESPGGLNIDASTERYIVIEAENNGILAVDFEVFFRRVGDGNWSAVNSALATMNTDAGFATYVIDMQSSSNWNGVIDQFRVDPMADGPGHMMIQSIRLESSPPPP